MNKLMITLIGAIGVVSCAFGKSAVWTGSAGPAADGKYYWTNALNWAESKKPENGDVLVFDPGEGQTITVVRPKSFRPGGHRFLSGTTKLTCGVSGDWNYQLNSSTATNEYYVAEGATASDNGLVIGYAVKPFLKSGKGAMSFPVGFFPNGNHASAVVVEAGTLSVAATSGDFYSPNVIVRSGATFFAARYSVFSTTSDVLVEKGATFRIAGGSGNNFIGALEGAGDVVDLNYQSPLYMTVPAGRNRIFSGTINNQVYPTLYAKSQAYWVIGAADSLKNANTTLASRWLSFMPGVGTFTLPTDYRCNVGYPLHLADTDGNPVTVIAGVSAGVATFSVDGPGNFYPRSDVTFTKQQVQLTGTLGVNNTKLTLGNGTAADAFDFSTIGTLDIGGASGQIRINNGAATTVGAKVIGNGVLTVLSPTTFANCQQNGQLEVGADVTVQDGAWAPQTIRYLASGKTLTLGGGVLVWPNNPTINSGVTGSGLTFDGGTVRTPFASAGTKAPFGSLAVRVGAKGGTLQSQMGKAAGGAYESLYGCYMSVPAVESAVTSGVDGGLRHTGYADYLYGTAPQISGPFEAEGGVLHVTAEAALPASGGFFGRGDLVLRNENLIVNKRTTAGTILLTDAGKTLCVDGGAMVSLRTDASGAAVSAEIGKLSVAADSALVIEDRRAVLGAADGATVKVTGGTVPVSEDNGRVLANVIGTQDKGTTFYFLGYDAENGFVPLSNACVLNQSTFEGAGATDVVLFKQNSDCWHETAANKSYAVDALMMKGRMSVKLGAKTTLTVGDGVQPGVIVFEKDSKILGNEGSGLRFGTSPALLLLGGCDNTPVSGNELSAPVLSANGLSVVGTADNSMFRAISFRAANAYSGETRIASACVKAANANCFSTGDVHVLPGERHGGQVRFTAAATWQNDFHVAGSGIRHSEWEGSQGNGALSFAADATVAGDVELTAPARFCTTASTVSGKVTGVVSGDRLDVLYSPGVIELSGANTYTGGTRVTYGKLALARGDAAGTGAVTLDNGTLRFTNAEPAVFTNAVTGTGLIELLGAPVTFTDASFGAFKDRSLAKGSVVSFPDVASSTVTEAAVLNGGTLDLGGADRTFGAIWGAGRIAGGTATVTGEIQPGGAQAIGTLTFDRPPVFAAGATYVCEDNDGTCDKLVVEDGDAAIGSLALRFALIGTVCGKGTAEILTAPDGAVTGTFASVTKTPVKAERVEIGYAPMSVNAILSKGFLIIVR